MQVRDGLGKLRAEFAQSSEVTSVVDCVRYTPRSRSLAGPTTPGPAPEGGSTVTPMIASGRRS